MTETSASFLERLRISPTPASWQQLVDLYAHLIRTWMRRYALQEHDQEDLVQEVLAALVTELPRFHYDVRQGSFRGWLRTIMVNRLRAFWRARDSRPLAAGGAEFAQVLDRLEDPHSDQSKVWNDLHDQYILQRLMEIIEHEFEPATWQAFQRVAVAGVKAAKVAQELGISVGAVYIAKSRVMRRLQEEKKGLLD
jgi:RNA polymerase sigma-70 factor (ECF subfamily)